jgi:hypothetical protein
MIRVETKMDFFVFAKVRNFAKFLSFSRKGDYAVIERQMHIVQTY